MAVLATLLLLIVIVGKYQAVSLAAAHAARNIAFDCAVLPQDCQGGVPSESTVSRVRNQFSGASGPDHHQAALWTTRRGQALLEKPDHLTAQLSHPSFDAGLGTAKAAPLRFAGRIINFASDTAGPDKFGLAITGGLVRTDLQLSLLVSRGAGQPAQILDGMPLRPNAHVAVLTDAWNASGPEGGAQSVRARFEKGWRLGGGVDEAFNVVYFATKLAMQMMHDLFIEDRKMSFQRPTIDVEIVPSDRLPGASGATP